MESIILNDKSIDNQTKKSIEKLLEFVNCKENWNTLESSSKNLPFLQSKAKFILKKLGTPCKILLPDEPDDLF